MSNQTSVNKFEAFIATNLPKVLKKASEDSLGDRSTYVGSSDIGGCLRKAYLDKISETNYDLATLIRFQRGHISENIVAAMLDGLNYDKQVECETEFEGFELKSHIDFLLKAPKELVIVEAKSVQSEVDAPYPSWVFQVQYQLHLLKQSTNKPLRAFVIALNINTGWHKVFDVSYNATLAELALSNAKKLIQALQTKIEPEPKEQLYCSTCPHKASCPLLTKGVQTLSDDALILGRKLTELYTKKKEVEKALEQAKVEFEDLMRSLELSRVKVDENLISLSKDSTSVSFDTKALKDSEPELYESLYAKYQKTINRKGYLSVK